MGHRRWILKFLTFGRRTGLRVSALALGTGNFGTGWGHGAERDQARAIWDSYVAAGGNFIDTANGYQAGQSEVMVGEFLAPVRDDFVLATKYVFPTTPSEGIGRTGASRKTMIQSVEASLRRLKTDRVDILWAHLDDGVTPVDEILRGFEDLVRAGKILYGGLSNFPAWKVARADAIAELRGWTPLAGIQVEYSLAERTPDRELLPMIEALGLGGALWSPLAGGFLTGKYRQGDDGGRLKNLGILVHTEKGARETALLDAVIAVAREVDATPTHVAIAWLLHRAARSATGLVPILGPRTREQLAPCLAGAELALAAAQVERLDAVSRVVPGVPHEQIEREAGLITGGDATRLRRPPVPSA